MHVYRRKDSAEPGQATIDQIAVARIGQSPEIVHLAYDPSEPRKQLHRRVINDAPFRLLDIHLENDVRLDIPKILLPNQVGERHTAFSDPQRFKDHARIVRCRIRHGVADWKIFKPRFGGVYIPADVSLIPNERAVSISRIVNADVTAVRLAPEAHFTIAEKACQRQITENTSSIPSNRREIFAVHEKIRYRLIQHAGHASEYRLSSHDQLYVSGAVLWRQTRYDEVDVQPTSISAVPDRASTASTAIFP